ncbi:PREDICTED: transmembrane protein 170B isoform X3 [Lepidothrix coronata]|uniref:Transmembrane protein 170B isoform X3 n=1 Tax=Lepidothrix coronata TaxID=321398 RepID=A0A6J0GQ15_9PASS|nr:PREDICTED: transmembrane protein 170B isoform X3 [Lepidothrix coronata]
MDFNFPSKTWATLTVELQGSKGQAGRLRSVAWMLHLDDSFSAATRAVTSAPAAPAFPSNIHPVCTAFFVLSRSAPVGLYPQIPPSQPRRCSRAGSLELRVLMLCAARV